MRLAVLAGVLVWVMGVAASLSLAYGYLAATEEAIEDARGALEASDVEGAASAFTRAEAEARSALRQLRAPHVRIAAAVPVLGGSIRVVEVIAEGSAEVAGATHGLLVAATGLPEGVDSLSPRDGSLPVTAIEEIAPHVSEVASTLQRSITELQDAPSQYVVEPVARERERFLDRANPAAASASRGAALVQHLPSFLGAEGPRRYLYVASNPAEPRGTGGYFGSYAVIEIDGGSFEIGDWTPAYELPTRPSRDVEPPNASFGRRYDAFGGAGFWQNINMTPDFPSAAAAMRNLWEATGGEPVDGVISVDPFALQALLEVAGPVSVGGRAIDASNVVTYVTNEAYEELGEGSERQEIIGEVAEVALETYLRTAGIGAMTQAIEPLGRSIRGGHLKVYSADPEVQRGFESAGLGGGFPRLRGDVVGIALNDGSATKLDFYGQRTVDYDVTLQRHGRASGRVRFAIRNEAPTSGRSRHIIGPNVDSLAPGEMQFMASVYCSARCRISEPDGEGVRGLGVSREQGLAFIDRWLRVPSGGEGSFEYVLETDGAWEDRDGTTVYRLSYDDQVTVRPTALNIRVKIPEGFEPVRLPSGAEVEDGTVVWHRDGERGDVELELHLRPVT
jgi:hypothetical protein